MGSKSRRTRLALSRSKRRFSFERRIRVWLYLLGTPTVLLCWLLLHEARAELLVGAAALVGVAVAWVVAVALRRRSG